MVSMRCFGQAAPDFTPLIRRKKKKERQKKKDMSVKSNLTFRMSSEVHIPGCHVLVVVFL